MKDTNDIVDELINDQYTEHCISDYMNDNNNATAWLEFINFYSSLDSTATMAEITEYLTDVITPFVEKKIERPDVGFSKGSESDHKREMGKAA